MKIDKINDEFIVDCTNNSKEERQQVYKFLVDNRNYGIQYLSKSYPIIICNKQSGTSNWDTLIQYYNWLLAKKDIPVYTFEQFKEMYLNENDMKTYTIQELRNAPIQIKVYSQEQAIQLAYAVGSKTSWKPFNAIYPIYCYLDKYDFPTWNSSENERKSDKPTIIEFNQIENFMENKTIIGYKLIKLEYKEAALAICHTVGNWENSLAEYDINTNQKEYIRKLTNAKVLDLWFEKVYEQEKQIVKMYSSNKGEFKIEVIDGKAYYSPENKHLPKEWIRDIINSYGNILIQKNVINPYNVEISSINVGCYHNCKKEDWENVYKLLK